MTARERIQQEAEQWFLTEPVLFAVYCSHRLVMNANMLCQLRTGKGRIEYNPTAIDALQDNQLKDLLKVEMIRILLQHPYARQPLGCFKLPVIWSSRQPISSRGLTSQSLKIMVCQQDSITNGMPTG